MTVEFQSIEQLPAEDLPYIIYYTVRLEGKDFSEFEDFQKRKSVDARDRMELQELNRFIIKLGKERGALARHFKKEDFADRFLLEYYDPTPPGDYGLRLYCKRLSEKVVIIFNGDRKTTEKAQDCPACSPHFALANSISQAIDTAIYYNQIEFDDEGLLLDEGFVLTI